MWEEYDKSAEAELDEMWSFVQNKDAQRWLWLAVDHNSNTILAYTFGERKDKVFRELKGLLEPFGINMFYTDDWGAYERNLESENHTVGKKSTQKIERKNLTLRTRIKRLCRKTICFSKSIKMHDIVIGLVIGILEFGWSVDAWLHTSIA
jgi:insertion element IS1 protein InsB